MARERCPRCSSQRVDGTDTCPRCQWRFSTPSTAPPSPSILGSRCPNCSRYAGIDVAFCPHCGTALREAAAVRRPTPATASTGVPPTVDERRRSPLNRLLRTALTIWLVAYPVLSCGPVAIGMAAGGSTAGLGVLGGLLVGSVLWWPWIVGIIVLGLLVLLTMG